MKQLFSIVSIMIIANFTISSIVSAEVASSEHKREIKREFAVSSSPSLSINNEFGTILIIEGASDKIIFKITITGKGKDGDAAKTYAESVDVDFKQSGNNLSAKTVFEKIRCGNNCGRNVDYEVTVPKNTKQVLENKFGDIKMNNAVEPLEVKLEFGKLYANELSDANLTIKHGGATINKSENMKIKSSFSKYKLGEIESMSGSISYDGVDIETLGNGDIKSDFSNMDIDNFKGSFHAKDFTYGSLKITSVSDNFSNIKVNSGFSTVKIGLTKNHNFKATLYSSFGSIKTGSVVFYEKTLDKKDVVVGIAGKIKEPSATVEISSSYGNIVFQ
ncbi:MAG: DUF4097 domain-containing protein [Tannerella sp.]|jgi:hypothetical protein|nr:DUF4097 domain-containing protein [Tannerella sp.]